MTRKYKAYITQITRGHIDFELEDDENFSEALDNLPQNEDDICWELEYPDYYEITEIINNETGEVIRDYETGT